MLGFELDTGLLREAGVERVLAAVVASMAKRGLMIIKSAVVDMIGFGRVLRRSVHLVRVVLTARVCGGIRSDRLTSTTIIQLLIVSVVV